MKIYSFKYLWSDTIYVRVMAQDLLNNAAWSGAVVSQSNGFYAVNYAMLGLRMATLDESNKARHETFSGYDSIKVSLEHAMRYL